MSGLHILIFLVRGAIAFVRVASYLMCLMGIHLSVAAISLSSRLWSDGRRGHQRNDATLVGFLVGVNWAAYLIIIVALFSGWPRFTLTAFIISVPLSLVIGFQVGRWRNAQFWANHSQALSLGQYRTSNFFVNTPYTVNPDERTKHLWIVGATGSGKSTLIRNLILSDMRQGLGLCVIDPKDDLVDSLLPHIPKSREKDVVLFDATDTDYPLGFNSLAGIPESKRSLATSELIAVFKRYFAASWGSRLEHILTNVILALLEYPEATLLDIPRLLLDEQFAKAVVANTRNPGVRRFFETEFESLLKKRGDALTPILNKVGPWLAYPELRNIIGQPQSSFNVREVMDRGKILLVRIPQGALGEEVSSLLAALITTKIQLAAHSRVDTLAQNRRFFSLYVDEFQLYANLSFVRMLTEARAFKLGLVCANQYPEQLTNDLQLALQHNAATTAHCLRQPNRYALEVSRLQNGQQSEPMVLTPAPPTEGGDPARAAYIRSLSQRSYGRSRHEVEARILSRLGNAEETQPENPRREKASKPPARVHIGVDIDEE